MLAIRTRVEDVTLDLTGTVLGFSKQGNPIILDDADGKCFTGLVTLRWSAMPTPREVATIARERRVMAFDLMRNEIYSAVTFAVRQVKAAGAKKRASLARYYGGKRFPAFGA